MGCGNSSTAPSSAPAKKGTIWADLKQKLPLDRTPAEEKKRESLFKKFDVRKNKSLSESECLAGCQNHLDLQKMTTNLPAINARAFKAASNLRTKADATSDVDAAEFRLYLVYLRDYFELYVMFDELDTSDDKYVSIDEFKKALPKIEKWGVVVTDANAKYAEIDTKKNDMGISFDEFASWALAQNLDAERDASLNNGANNNNSAAPVPAAAAPAPAPAAASRDINTEEKPKAEEPKAEEPNAEEPKAEEPKAEEPKAEEPKAEEPKAEEPKAEDQVEEMKAEEPQDEIKKADEPSKADAPAAGITAADRARLWVDIQGRLPRLKEKQQNADRSALFKEFDPNGNGYLSLAEVDAGCRSILKLHEFTDDLSPIIKRAFDEAKTAGAKAGFKSANADFVQRVEFRLFLVYVYDYFEMWVMFDELDSSADNKISIGEFKAAIPKIESWGVKVEDVEGTFKQVDKAGEGVITFNEFCDWAIAMHLDADGDIDNEEE